MRFVLTVATILGLAVTAARAITLTRDGQPAATIVIRQSALAAKPYAPDYPAQAVPGADAKVRLAANDLQAYIEKISGAKLPIAGDTAEVDGAVILVGVSKRTAALKIDIPHGLTAARDEEGYVIVSRDDALVLAGNEDGQYWGTYYAVAEFLNRLGVRWFMPGDFGEVVPGIKTITFANRAVRDRPDFKLRTWWGYIPNDMMNQEMLWKLRNKMQIFALLPIAGDSSVRNYMPDKALTATHPEYFAKLADGTVDPYNPNLTNPEMPGLIAQKMIAYIKAEQERTGALPLAIPCAPDDGMPVDYTPETMKANQDFTEVVGREGIYSEISVSEEWFAFLNKAAAELAKVYPDVKIASNGYANRNTPPEGVTLHPNIMIMYASIWADTLKAFDNPRSWHGAIQGAMLKRWCELCPSVSLYRYNYSMLGTSLTPIPMVRKLARDYPLYKKWGVIGFSDEQKPATYMEQGIPTFYLRARMEWKAGLDVRGELDDYFDTWYGNAARPAQAFWEALEERIETTPFLGHEERILPNVYTPDLIATLERELSRAEQLADTERTRTHVAIDRHILEHLKAYMKMWEADASADYAGAARQCDVMLAERAKLTAICPFLTYPEKTYEDGMARYYSGTWGSGLSTSKKPFYQELDGMISGKTGDLIAMGARKVRFSLDEADKGRYLRWYAPDFDRSGWQTIDTTKAYYAQAPGCLSSDGVPYRGMMWYVFDMDVPRSAAGKTVKVYSPAVVTEAWVWVNGRYVGHRPYLEPYTRPAILEFDVTGALKPGAKNTIAVRVSTATNRTQAPEGFQGRLFLYAPKPAKD